MQLYARIRGNFRVVPIIKDIPQELPGATSYYVRLTDSETHKPKNHPVGPNLKDAYAEFLRMKTTIAIGRDPAILAKSPLADASGRVTLRAAADQYFSNCEALGRSHKTMSVYKLSVNAFVDHCGVKYVDEVSKQVLINFMRWLRSQPVPVRTHSNPARTLANKVGHVRIFLKTFGHSRLLTQSETPKYHKKKVVKHTDDELAILYGEANADEKFLLDFFIGSMARDHEAYGEYGHPDLADTTLTLYGKQHKTRTVEIPAQLAADIRERRMRSGSQALFVGRNGQPDTHLLRKLQGLAKRAGATFHTELHKLRKTGASRRFLAGRPLTRLMNELGHESLAVTQDYLDDVTDPEESKTQVEGAVYVPKPQLVRDIVRVA